MIWLENPFKFMNTWLGTCRGGGGERNELNYTLFNMEFSSIGCDRTYVRVMAFRRLIRMGEIQDVQ